MYAGKMCLHIRYQLTWKGTVLHIKYKTGFLKWQVAKDEKRRIGKEPSMPIIA